MVTLSYKELKAVAKIRKIKDYKRMSEDELLKALEESEKPKPPKTIKEIRKENYDSDKIIRDLRALHESDEDYYEPKKINGAFNDNYVEYESNGDKDKKLSIEGLEEKMKKRNLVFNSVDALYYKLHRTSLDRGG